MDYMFFTFLTHMSNFMLIKYYLLYEQWTYFLYIILDYKNLQIKKLINNIVIDLWFSQNFASMKDIRRKWNSIVNLSKFTSNKKILSEVLVLDYNQICN